MKFAPKSEKQIQAERLLPAGEYEFEVLERALLGSREWQTCETQSSSGKDMIQLVVKVTGERQSRVVIDYLMPASARKLRHAADACGILDMYEGGEIHAEDFIGGSGRLRLRIEVDPKGHYADRNGIADYVMGSNRERVEY